MVPMIYSIRLYGAGRSLADVADPDVGMTLLDSADIQTVFADNSAEDVPSVPNAPVYAWHSGTDVVNVALIVTI